MPVDHCGYGFGDYEAGAAVFEGVGCVHGVWLLCWFVVFGCVEVKVEVCCGPAADYGEGKNDKDHVIHDEAKRGAALRASFYSVIGQVA